MALKIFGMCIDLCIDLRKLLIVAVDARKGVALAPRDLEIGELFPYFPHIDQRAIIGMRKRQRFEEEGVPLQMDLCRYFVAWNKKCVKRAQRARPYGKKLCTGYGVLRVPIIMQRRMLETD